MSIAEPHTDRSGGPDQIGIERHGLILPTTSHSRHVLISGGSKATIVPELAGLDQFDRLAAEAGGQEAIDTRGRSSSLKMTEHDRPRKNPHKALGAGTPHVSGESVVEMHANWAGPTLDALNGGRR